MFLEIIFFNFLVVFSSYIYVGISTVLLFNKEATFLIFVIVVFNKGWATSIVGEFAFNLMSKTDFRQKEREGFVKELA
jgi:hypothetical protein